MKKETIFVIGLALLLCAGCVKKESTQVQPDVGSESFFVYLQEGFSGESVRILIDGRLIFEGKPTTNPLLGIAHEFPGSAASTDIKVMLEIPKRNIKSVHSIDLTKARGLGISIRTGKVTIVQAKAFVYE